MALVEFEVQNVTVQESTGEVTFRVLLSDSAAIELSVLFKTEDLEATGKTTAIVH